MEEKYMNTLTRVMCENASEDIIVQGLCLHIFVSK